MLHMPRRRLHTRWALLLVLALSMALAACDETAELIPGDISDLPAETTPTPTPDDPDAEPLIAPGGLTGGAGRGAQRGPQIPDTELARSVVQVTTLSLGLPQRNGSGVMIDTERGLLLTSAELVRPFRADGANAYTDIVISTNRTPGQDPVEEYTAKLAQIDSTSGIAVLRIVAAAGGGALAAGDIDLPAVTIGDPLVVQREDALRLFGHPGLGAVPTAQAVTVTEASVVGFRGDRTGARHWMMTDARIPWGAAGGPVFNYAGELIGLLSQVAYAPEDPVGYARLIHHASDLIEAARDAETVTSASLLHHPSAAPGSSAPRATDGAVVTAPVFAENAVETQGSRDLFDYASVLPEGVPEIYYEFAAQGVADGAPVQELWYLNEVLQDGVSSSYTWSFGSLATVSDRLIAPAAQGIPTGRWRLEVWIDGTLRSAGSVHVGVAPQTPSITKMRFSTAAGFDQQPVGPAFSGATRLLGFFDYADAALAQTVRWVVFYEGRLIYQSPAVPWTGGDSGTWWVGHLDPGGISVGNWEIEVYFDNRVAGSGSTTVF